MYINFNKFRRDQKGSIASVFALSLLPLMLASGAVIDYGRATQVRTKLQSSADNAALTALLGPASLREATVDAILAQKHDLQSSTVTVGGNEDELLVEVRDNVKTAILNVVRIDEMPISARARAVKMYEGLPPCILGLNPTSTNTITFAGTSEFEAKDCVVHSNSSHPTGMTMEGGAVPVAAGFCSTGGVSTSRTITPMPREQCERMKDPFVDLEKPFSGGCNFNNVSVDPKQNRVLKPGIYCGGLELKGTVRLEPGVYVIKNGLLSITSQSNVTAHEVMFFLTGTNAGFSFDAGGVLDLRAPKGGAYGGLLVFQDPLSNPNYDNKLVGSSDSVVIGGIYTPTQKVTLQGGSGFGQTSSFMPVIADKIRVAGSTTTTSDLDGISLIRPLPKSFSGVRLVE
jgi:Flp pilus assembly protein TadG